MLLINGILFTNTQASLFGTPFFGQPTPSAQDRCDMMLNTSFPGLAGCPCGYDTSAIIPPVKDGSLSSFSQCNAKLTTSVVPLYGGKDLSGVSDSSLSVGQASLALLVPLSGSSAMKMTVSPSNLTGVTNLGGTSTSSLQVVNAALGLIVDLEGSSTSTLSASANLTGLAHLVGLDDGGGVMTESTIAAAVWARMLSGGATSAEDALLSAGAAGDPWSANLSLGEYTSSQAGALFLQLVKILRNKTITDPVAGTITVYDNDGTTILFQASLFEDASGTTAYRGQGAERRERLE